MTSTHLLREGARPEVVRDILGHANIDVTQNVYGRSCWEQRGDAVTQAVEAVTSGGWPSLPQHTNDRAKNIRAAHPLRDRGVTRAKRDPSLRSG